MRFCTNCGERLRDDQMFCPNCGTPVKCSDAQPVVSFEPAANAADKTKKKVPGWLIAVICAFVVLVIAVLLLGYFLLGWFRAPHARLQNYLDKGAKLTSAAILAQESPEAFSTDSTLSLDAADITLPAEADSSVYYLFGMDTKTLLNAISLDLNMDVDPSKDGVLLETALNLSGSALMGYTFTADDKGLSAYASSTGDYAIAPWDTVGIPYPFGSTLEKEDIAELILSLSEAGKLLLTKESVEFERGYKLACGDGEDVRCNRYVICPDEGEWEDFLKELADLLESNDTLSAIVTKGLQTNSYNTMTVAEIADSIREQAEDAAANLADSDTTLELYVKGTLPVGMAFSMDDSYTEISVTFASRSGAYRGMTVDVESDNETVLSVELDNAHTSKGDAESGNITGTMHMPDSDMAIKLDGDYDGASFDLTVNIQQGSRQYPLKLKNECSVSKDTREGTFSLRLSAPEEDGLLGVVLDYEYSTEKKSVLHVPYGTFDISLEMKNLTYMYDDMISSMKLTLTVGENKKGGTDHRLTLKNLLIDEVAIGEASIILTTTDEPTTAKRPSGKPTQGDLSSVTNVITGGLPTNLW